MSNTKLRNRKLQNRILVNEIDGSSSSAIKKLGAGVHNPNGGIFAARKFG
jgi:hypothetical protein